MGFKARTNNVTIQIPSSENSWVLSRDEYEIACSFAVALDEHCTENDESLDDELWSSELPETEENWWVQRILGWFEGAAATLQEAPSELVHAVLSKVNR